MKRRSFIGSVAASVSAAPFALAGVSTPAIGSDTRTWRFQTAWPKGFPGLGTGAEYFANQVNRLSGGRLNIELYGAGEIVPWNEVMNAVSDGTIEMGHGSPYYWHSKAPANNFLGNFPFGFTAQEFNAWYFYGGGAEVCDQVYRDEFGCKFVLCGHTGAQFAGWSNTKIESADDFEGLKMRLSGLSAEVARRAGATVVNVGGGEVAQALASGTVDWVQWNNPYGESGTGLWRHAKYYHYPSWGDPSASIDCPINLKAWEELPDDLKGVVEQCAHATTLNMLSEFVGRSGPILEKLVREEGVELAPLPDDALTKFGNIMGEVIADLIEEDDLARMVYKSMYDFRRQMIRYGNVTDRAYLSARDLPYTFPEV